MFFEGPEKKFELLMELENENHHFLSWHPSFWSEVVAAAQATILSTLENEHCRAYLLSESSLFVFKDRVLMITCGSTVLVNALEMILNKVSKNLIRSLIFQRKNEFLPQFQRTHFYNDAQKLKTLINGESILLGSWDQHYNLIYHAHSEEHKHRPFSSSEHISLENSQALNWDEDLTLELLMYHLDKDVSHFFMHLEQNDPQQAKSHIRDFFSLEELFPEFVIDDYIFEPYGYSLNAIYQDYYFTIHVTPQPGVSYISFETNIRLQPAQILLILSKVKPKAFDLITFNGSLDSKHFLHQYLPLEKQRTLLAGIHQVEFTHYFRINHQAQWGEATSLSLLTQDFSL